MTPSSPAKRTSEEVSSRMPVWAVLLTASPLLLIEGWAFLHG